VLNNSSDLKGPCELYSLFDPSIQVFLSDPLNPEHVNDPDSGVEVLYCLSQNASEQCVIVTDVLFWRIISVILILQILAMSATSLLSKNTLLLWWAMQSVPSQSGLTCYWIQTPGAVALKISLLLL